MRKDIYRLTESELKEMIKESAMKILSELDWRTYASAAKKNDEWRKEHPIHRANQWNRSYDFQNAATDAFNKKYGLEKQYDEPNGGEKGQIHLNPFNDFKVSGSRDHDFGDDGGPFDLKHHVYHMSKEYGKNGGYGRTRMWDRAHETTPEEFYGNEEMGRKFRDAEKDAEDFRSGKSHYVSGKGWSNESKQPRKSLKEWLQNNKHVTTVTRDRASAYAKTIEEVLPDCMQIADRFHIHQNLLDAVNKVLGRTIPATTAVTLEQNEATNSTNTAVSAMNSKSI